VRSIGQVKQDEGMDSLNSDAYRGHRSGGTALELVAASTYRVRISRDIYGVRGPWLSFDTNTIT
jgi:hypothetical protein